MNFTRNRPILRLTVNAVSLALYIVLSLLSVETNVFKITFDGLPVIFAAIACGPIDGMLVGLLGSFIGEFFSPYGLTVTTPLWILPAAIRGLIVGLIFMHKNPKDHKILWIFTVILSGLAVTAINTLVIFIDAKIFEYPPAITWASVGFRVLANIITSALYIFVVPVLMVALLKAGVLTPKQEKNSSEQ